MPQRRSYIGKLNVPGTPEVKAGQAVFAKALPVPFHMPANGLRLPRRLYPGSETLFPFIDYKRVFGATGFGTNLRTTNTSGSDYAGAVAGGGILLIAVEHSTTDRMYVFGAKADETTPVAETNTFTASALDSGPVAINGGTGLVLTENGFGKIGPIGGSITGDWNAIGSSLPANPKALCATDRGFEVILNGNTLAFFPTTVTSFSGLSSLAITGISGSPSAMAYDSGTYIIGTTNTGLFRMLSGSRAAPVVTQVLSTTGLCCTVKKIGTVWYALIADRLYKSTDDGVNWTLAAQSAATNELILEFDKNSDGNFVWLVGRKGAGITATDSALPSTWIAVGGVGLLDPVQLNVGAFDRSTDMMYGMTNTTIGVTKLLDDFQAPALTSYGPWLPFIKYR